MQQEYSKLSFWHDSVPGPLNSRSALEKDIEADVVIVGAGYTGLWTAYYLKQIDASLDIVILEAEIAGFGASGRNGGWCASYLSGIEDWLDDPLRREAGIRLQKLMFNTVSEVGRVVGKESIDCHFEQSGALEIAVIPGQLARLREEMNFLQRLGFGEGDYRWLSQSDLQNVLRVDQALAGIHLQHCAAIHPFRLARGLAETIEDLGVSIYEKSPVTEIRDKQLITPNARVKAAAVVIATEGYSATIAGRDRLLMPVHSMMVVTEPLSDQQLKEIHFHKRFCFGKIDYLTTYGQLTEDRRIAYGCRGTYYYGARIRSFEFDAPEFEHVSKSLLQIFPCLEGIGFTHGWGGAMGVQRTLRPSVNFDQDRRFGWAGGYFGNGVGASHLAGQTMAELVSGMETERTDTPWVNPEDRNRKWEPEPLRWLGVRSRTKMMQLADWAEYRGNRFAPLIGKTLDKLFP